jgi:hypothetical protein
MKRPGVVFATVNAFYKEVGSEVPTTNRNLTVEAWPSKSILTHKTTAQWTENPAVSLQRCQVEGLAAARSLEAGLNAVFALPHKKTRPRPRLLMWVRYLRAA